MKPRSGPVMSNLEERKPSLYHRMQGRNLLGCSIAFPKPIPTHPLLNSKLDDYKSSINHQITEHQRKPPHESEQVQARLIPGSRQKNHQGHDEHRHGHGKLQPSACWVTSVRHFQTKRHRHISQHESHHPAKHQCAKIMLPRGQSPHFDGDHFAYGFGASLALRVDNSRLMSIACVTFWKPSIEPFSKTIFSIYFYRPATNLSQ